MLRLGNKIHPNEAREILLEAEMYQRKEPVARVEAGWFRYDTPKQFLEERRSARKGRPGKVGRDGAEKSVREGCVRA